MQYGLVMETTSFTGLAHRPDRKDIVESTAPVPGVAGGASPYKFKILVFFSSYFLNQNRFTKT